MIQWDLGEQINAELVNESLGTSLAKGLALMATLATHVVAHVLDDAQNRYFDFGQLKQALIKIP